MENENRSQAGFAQRRLPWIIAAAAFVLYSVTLTRWETFTSLPYLAQATGWDWHLSYHHVLQLLITYPVRWLPSSWQLVALHELMALCAAATLGLLARVVALLPHDRTKEQRQLERSDFSYLTLRAAWIPPLLAAMVCGLQLTFWENAVIATGEALDIVLFAVVVWSLMEYRIDEKDWRLYVAAFVQAAGMTNNFAMIAFLPAFLVAVAWIKGPAFFNARFVVRLAGAGVVGLLFYFVLPLWNTASELTHLTFWQVLLVNLGLQKSALLGFPRYLLMILGLTSLVPVLFIGIRWPAQVGDISAVGAALTRVMILVVHAVFLAACLYVAFDPPFSPRKLGGGYDFLPLYFLGALSVGYFSGYFLLVCSTRPRKSWEHPSPILKALNHGVVGVIWLALVAIPVLLVQRNYPALQDQQGQELKLYADAALDTLPEKEPAIVLSDDERRLLALQSALQRERPDHSYLLISSGSIGMPAYHRWQHGKHPDRWPATLASRSLVRSISDSEILQFVVQLSSNAPVYYLHHSFGYYFEHFHGRTRGLLSQLIALPTNAIRAPSLTAEEIQANEQYFEGLYERPVLQQLIQNSERKQKDKGLNVAANYYEQIFSAAFTSFGVALQKAGHLEKAGLWFERALAVHSKNPSAYINQAYNVYLQDPSGTPPQPDEQTKQLLEPYGGNWNTILSLNGPLDAPTTCFLLAQVFVQGNNFRQAAQQLLRALELDPAFYLARISLAGIYVKLGRPDDTLQLVSQLHSMAEPINLPMDVRMKLMEAEAWAYVLKGEPGRAVNILQEAQRSYPKENEPFSVLANIYLSTNRRTNAIPVYEEQLRQQPANVAAMVNLSALQIVVAQYDEAIAVLDKAASLDPKNQGVLMNRAIAHLNANHLEEAKRDYEVLNTIALKPIAAAAYGLGEVAWLRKDYPEALKRYKRFLEIAQPGTPEIPIVKSRIVAIKSGSL